MTDKPVFVHTGTGIRKIDVRLSYDLVKLFSEGLYKSPNKAVEELVSNSFDAGAQRVHVILSQDLQAQGATIAVVDDGGGMDGAGLQQHWHIGKSNKRDLTSPPRGRKQIGKFGIGKVSTYVLANRLTHVSKCGAKYYSTSMDYRDIDEHTSDGIMPNKPIQIPLRKLTAKQAMQAVESWAKPAGFDIASMPLFGNNSPETWTISIMSELKEKVAEIAPGRLRWILRTAMPLRPNFAIWLNGEELKSSKADIKPFKKWVIGRDITYLSRPSPKGVAEFEDKNVPESSEHRFGLDVPGLGRVTGYAEAYKDPFKGKSDHFGRSHGFFVRVRDRLLNLDDDHFGISSNKLRHGTFSRFRLVVHMDELDDKLRSTREDISEGPQLETARNVLWAIFNKVRPAIERHDQEEEPGAKLARRLAATPVGLSRGPIVELARAVAEGKKKSRYLMVPNHASIKEREAFLATISQKAQNAEEFLTGKELDFDGTSHDGIVKFDTSTGVLRLNGWHPFIAAFDKEFSNSKMGQPLEIFAMAEVLAEAHLHTIGVSQDDVDNFLLMRDRLLRDLANESGRQSASSVANELSNARNNPDRLEECVRDAFRMLGFDARRLGGPDNPDGIASAILPADDGERFRRCNVSLEAKSKEDPEGKVDSKSVDIGAIIRHRNKHKCDHAVVVGPRFATSRGGRSALGQSIEDDKQKTKAANKPRTVTLINIDDLVQLVRLRPRKQLNLQKICELFECSLPDESKKWVKSIRDIPITKPPYRKIVETIESRQSTFLQMPVKFAALQAELRHLKPPIIYDTDDEVKDICRAMSHMAPKSISITGDKVALEQSAQNVIAEIMDAMQENTYDEQ